MPRWTGATRGTNRRNSGADSQFLSILPAAEVRGRNRLSGRSCFQIQALPSLATPCPADQLSLHNLSQGAALSVLLRPLCSCFLGPTSVTGWSQA